MWQWLGMPVDASTHGAALDKLTLFIHLMMFVLFVGWSVYFLYALFRFHRSRHPKADYVGLRNRFPIYLVFIVAFIEGVLLVGYSLPLWDAHAEQFPPEKDSLIVKITGEQFAWNIHYPGPDGIFGKQDAKLVTSENPMGLDKNDPNGKDDIITINNFHLPVGKPVIIHLSSKDVIHCLALQQMRVKQDAIPGSSIPVWFIPTMTSAEIRETMIRTVEARKPHVPAGSVAMAEYKAKDDSVIVKKLDLITDKVLEKLGQEGIHFINIAPSTPTEITCAQLCGLGHYRMRGYYTVETKEEFEKWLKEQSAASSGGGSSYE